jgi:hypothetical protein
MCLRATAKGRRVQALQSGIARCRTAFIRAQEVELYLTWRTARSLLTCRRFFLRVSVTAAHFDTHVMHAPARPVFQSASLSLHVAAFVCSAITSGVKTDTLNCPYPVCQPSSWCLIVLPIIWTTWHVPQEHVSGWTIFVISCFNYAIRVIYIGHSVAVALSGCFSSAQTHRMWCAKVCSLVLWPQWLHPQCLTRELQPAAAAARELGTASNCLLVLRVLALLVSAVRAEFGKAQRICTKKCRGTGHLPVIGLKTAGPTLGCHRVLSTIWMFPHSSASLEQRNTQCLSCVY